MANLQLVPQSWHSWSFYVNQGSAPIAQILATSYGKEKAELRIGAARYRAFREHLMSGSYLLADEAGRFLARTEKPSALLNLFRVEFSGRVYTLKKESFLGRNFLLLDNDREIGFVKPEGCLTRKAQVSLPEELPLLMQLFVMWLVIVLWKRESDSSAAAMCASF